MFCATSFELSTTPNVYVFNTLGRHTSAILGEGERPGFQASPQGENMSSISQVSH